MRVLLDVNILVRSNEKSRGPARKLLLGLIARGHTILTSADILIELAQVLRYPRIQALFGLSEEQIYEYIQFLKDACEIVLVDQIHNAPIRDLSDTPVLRTAIAGDPEYICTVDKDFYTEETIAFCALLGISVLDDVALLARLPRHSLQGLSSSSDLELVEEFDTYIAVVVAEGDGGDLGCQV